MKKIMAVILAVVMFVSFIPFAYAAEVDYEISFGEIITVSVSSENFKFVKFTPEESGTYVLNAYSDDIDTVCYLFASPDDEEYILIADDENGSDFSLEYEFEAGETYYFLVGTYNEDEFEFEISLECGHVFADGVCTVCGEVCDHSESKFLGYCLCGEIFVGKDINDGDETEVETKTYKDVIWFRFTPETDGAYSFKSVSEDCDPDCNFYDAEGSWYGGSYDANGMDFDLVYNFIAGETYYFEVYNCFGEGTFKVSLERLKHTADDGSAHALDFDEGTYSNCTEHGFTEGLYCSICDIYVSGHEEMPIDRYNHVDDDWDETCDLCGKENIYTCYHICHSENPFIMYIWQFANFLHRIFGVSPRCECGDYHYDEEFYFLQLPEIFG